MKPPSFFLSSTIYDFRDVRSALKYFLEQQGCSVLASEYNDFSKPLERHSYDACLQSISSADWFILLIGTRVGGWYDEAKRISITQQEYREAYKLHLAGRLKLLVFVRTEVWQMREERKELERHLSNLPMDAATKAAIARFPSKFADDAQFILEFVAEVGKNRETDKAVKTQQPLPSGNWIHPFATFRDIIEAVQIQPFMRLPTEEAGLRRLLRRELIGYIELALIKTPSGGVFSPRTWVDTFHDAHHFLKNNLKDSNFSVNTRLMDSIAMLSVYTLVKRFVPQVLNRALESTLFITYDNTIGGFAEKPVYGALLMLSREIGLFNLANIPEAHAAAYETSPRYQPNRGEMVKVPPQSLFRLLHVLDKLCNILALATAVVHHLDGKEFVMPSLRPFSPLSDIRDEIEQSRVSMADAENYVASKMGRAFL